MLTHEAFIAAVSRAAIARLEPDEAAKLEGLKMVYGAGRAGLRGVTYFNRWNEAHPFVEVCAFGQESHVQLAGTTIHELGHALAGWNAGHGPAWRAACDRLGLRLARAAGHRYLMASLAPEVRELVARLGPPSDGQPVKALPLGPRGGAPKGCSAGQGTRGGKSRGPGSGSRLRLWTCDCQPPQRARVASDAFKAQCPCCAGAFKRA